MAAFEAAVVVVIAEVPRWPVWATAAAALSFCYAPYLGGMADQWWHDEDMSHGFAVPLAIAWVVWRELPRLRTLETRPRTAWGLGLLGAGAGLHLAGSLGAGLFAGALGLMVSAAGIVVFFGGFELLRALSFPLLLSLFMLPKLAIVYSQATLPLQLLAGRLAAAGMTAAGVAVLRNGAELEVGGRRLLVEEACNGIRYLMALGFLSLLYGYACRAGSAARAGLFAAALPLAILANAVRVAVSAADPSLATGVPHILLGVFLFLACLATLGGVNRFCRRSKLRARP